MKGYLAKIAIIAALIVLCHYLILATVRSPLPAEYWVHEFIIVKRAQAEAMSSPKIIFVGGSTTLYGIDAAAVQESLHLPAINMGVHAAMPLDDQLDGPRAVARPGDIVLLSLEPPYYDLYSSRWTTWTLRNALAWDRDKIDRLPWWRRLQIYAQASDPMISWDLLWTALFERTSSPAVQRRMNSLRPAQEIVDRYRKVAGTSTGFSFDVSNLDQNCDFLNTVPRWPFVGEAYPTSRPAFVSSYARSLLVPFLSDMKRRQVKVLFDYTPYMFTGAPGKDWPKADLEFRRQLESIGGQLIENRDAFFYPNTMFFNANVHLDEEGRRLRTAALIQALKRYAVPPAGA